MEFVVKVPTGKRLVVREKDEEVKASFETKEINTSDESAIEVVVRVPNGKQFIVEASSQTEKENSEPAGSSKMINTLSGRRVPCDAEEIDVAVEIYNGETFNFMVKPSDTVFRLKKIIQRQTRFTVQQQYLIYNGQIMENSIKLAYYDITAASTITLVNVPGK